MVLHEGNNSRKSLAVFCRQSKDRSLKMSSTLQKKKIEGEDPQLVKSKKRRRLQYSFDWKFWVMTNFEIAEGAFINPKEMLDEAWTITEMSSPLSSTSLGKMIKEVWGDRVKVVQKGSRKDKRQRMYKNLRRKSSVSETEGGESILASLRKFVPSDGWIPVGCNSEEISFCRFQNWELDGQHVTTEVTVEKASCGVNVHLKSHGNVIDAKALNGGHTLTETTIKGMLDFASSSHRCKGFPLKDGDDFSSRSDHSIHEFREATLRERRVFARNCEIFLGNLHFLCANCAHLLRVNSAATKRKQEKCGQVSRYCNNRFLSNIELVEKLKREKKRARTQEQEQVQGGVVEGNLQVL